MARPAPADEPVYLTFADLQRRGVPYGRQRVWELMKAGEFPQCVKWGPHKNSPVSWIAEEVDAWIAARIRARPIVVNNKLAPKKRAKRGRTA